jgi:hypothetical protein
VAIVNAEEMSSTNPGKTQSAFGEDWPGSDSGSLSKERLGGGQLAAMFEIEPTFLQKNEKMRLSATSKPPGSGHSMSSEKRTAFLHRTNELGIFESACPACFEVISMQAREADLAAEEARHLCKELILKEALDYFRSQPVLQARGSVLRRKAAAGRRRPGSNLRLN